jgi:methylated-DNA-[protein]-cysteine S-methyltransferase
VEQTYYHSPIGWLEIRGSDIGVETVTFIDSEPVEQREEPEWSAQVMQQLNEYFRRKRQAFDLVLKPAGTDFQQRVWQELKKIPYGQTLSYGQVAKRIGRPEAVRAVGLANGQNPIALIVPCHRVISSDGRLTGYAGGLERKRWLLELESLRLF